MATLLPPNATATERALEQVIAKRTEVVAPIRAVWNPKTCPVEFLPWLAWALSLDTWDANWSETVKRARISNAIEIQRRKGTSKSVRDVVASYGGSVSVREWWETTPRGDPHTFSLTLFGGQADTVEAIVADVERTKPVRSRFTFTQAQQGGASIGVVAGFRPVIYARLNGLSSQI